MRSGGQNLIQCHLGLHHGDIPEDGPERERDREGRSRFPDLSRDEVENPLQLRLLVDAIDVRVQSFVYI